MKMVFFLFSVILVFAVNESVFTQDWKKIVPFVSTCKDVKKTLGTGKCQYPRSDFDHTDFSVSIHFYEGSCTGKEKSSAGQQTYSLPKGTVLSVSVRFKKLMALSDYKRDLSKYEVKQEPDLPNYKIYTNKEIGEEITVVNNEWIQNIFRFESSSNKQKFLCKK